MHPKIIDVHPKLIQKGGVVQFCQGPLNRSIPCYVGMAPLWVRGAKRAIPRILQLSSRLTIAWISQDCQSGRGGAGCRNCPVRPVGPGGPCGPGRQCGPDGEGGPGDQVCQRIWFIWSKQSDYREHL